MMNRISLFVFTWLMAGAQVSQGNIYEIMGALTDKAHGDPLAGVAVRFEPDKGFPEKTFSEEDGSFFDRTNYIKNYTVTYNCGTAFRYRSCTRSVDNTLNICVAGDGSNIYGECGRINLNRVPGNVLHQNIRLEYAVDPHVLQQTPGGCKISGLGAITVPLPNGQFACQEKKRPQNRWSLQSGVPLSFSAAVDYCTRLGGHLPRVNDFIYMPGAGGGFREQLNYDDRVGFWAASIDAAGNPHAYVLTIADRNPFAVGPNVRDLPQYAHFAACLL